jgi:hypothetical protein
MTAKESLRLLLDELSEEDAAQLLSEAEKLTAHGNGTPGTTPGSVPRRRLLSEVFAEIMADLPPEELAKIPPSSDIDHIVYGLPKTE